jgi:site-specific DNA recombinase
LIDPIAARESEASDGEENRAAIYARTSSKTQKFGHSLDEQVRLSVERCQSLDWEVIFVFRDEAESGKDTNRPMFQRLLRATERQVFDVVVFWKLDRFSRSLMHAVQLEARLREHDVALYSVTEQIDTTSASGRFNFRNIASAAEFERDMIKQRTQMGLQALAAERKWPNDTPPLGYTKNSNDRLEVDEESAQTVEQIFEMYLSTRSMPKVAEMLNDDGITTQAGGDWTPRAIADILGSKIYVGKYEVGEVEDQMPEYRLITDDTFEEVQRVRRRFRDDSSSRKSMTDDRKRRRVTPIYTAYEEFLTSDCT